MTGSGEGYYVYDVVQMRFGEGQEWEARVATCDSLTMAFAELDEELVKFPYLKRDDLRVVRRTEVDLDDEIEVVNETYDSTRTSGMQLMADAADTMMDDFDTPGLIGGDSDLWGEQ